MVRRVILDTGVLIGIERKKLDLDKIIGSDDIAISAITAMELLTGVELADKAYRTQRAVHVEALLGVLPIADYTMEVARVHTKLAIHARRLGRPRGAFDLIIAATAVATNRILLTTDAAASFEDLPGVQAEVVQ